MQLKTISLKYSIKKNTLLLLLTFFALNFSFSQEIIEEKEEVVKKKDSIKSNQRFKADGVAAVIGDFVLLDSDVDKEFAQIKAAGGSIDGIDRCQLFGRLLEDKLYAHHAIQDSITVNDLEIRSRIEQQFNYLLEETGSLDKLLAFYNKDTEDALREELFEINKSRELSNRMKQKIVEEVEITPEEVREFFNDIPEDERPIFGTELNVAQIIIIPEITEEEEQKVIDQLNKFKADVEDHGASFTSKVVLYTDDTASKKNGGKYTLNRKRPMFVKEFRDVAFSLQEGEISKPFKTVFGYHIIIKEKERGQEIDVRHILLRPKLTKEAVQTAKDEIDKIRQSIINGEITFGDAAREASDEDETKYEDGKLTNPETQDFNFELTRMDPELYAQIQDLKDDEVSLVLQDQDRINPIKFKILTVTNRVDEHEAEFARDYLKIKRLAETDKKIKAIDKWQKEKIKDTYIKINGEFRDCDFNGNWLKK